MDDERFAEQININARQLRYLREKINGIQWAVAGLTAVMLMLAGIMFFA